MGWFQRFGGSGSRGRRGRDQRWQRRAAVVAFIAALTASSAAEPSTPARRVLVINSYHPGYNWSDGEQAALLQTLVRERPQLLPHIEYMDWRRFPDNKRSRVFLDQLDAKYGVGAFDVIVALDEPALALVLAERERLGRNIPVVFGGINDVAPVLQARHPLLTGVAQTYDFGGTLRLVRVLQPELRRLLIVHCASESGLATRRNFDRYVASHPLPWELSWKAGDWSGESLLQDLSKLPSDTAVLLLSIFRDRDGRVLVDDPEFGKALVTQSRVPVYFLAPPLVQHFGDSSWETAVWQGLGGSLLSAELHGELVASLTLRVLAGEPAAQIPIVTDSPSRLAVDYDQLKRFGLTDAKLPEGALVVHQPRSFYELYRIQIQLALGVFAALLLTVLVLVWMLLTRRRAERALRKSEERYRSIFEQAPTGMFRAAVDGSLLDLNQAQALIVGFESRTAALCAPLDAWANVYNSEKWAEIVARLLKEERVESLELSITRVDGSSAWILLSARLERDQDGQPRHLEGNTIDITASKRAAALERAKVQAEAASVAKSRFLANMSHEIRTPMNAILGFTQLLNRDPALTADQRERIKIIDRNGEHLLTLINDVLDLSKIEANRATLNLGTFSPQRLISDLQSLFHARASAKGIELLIDVAPSTPANAVADAGKIRQVLSNLIGNAVKLTEHGRVIVRARAEPHGDKGWLLVLEVEDTGPGISAEDQARLFTEFGQGQAGRLAGGTGLGLALSRNFARLMGGDIRVKSREGEGTLFMVEVLLEPAPEGESVLARTRHVLKLAEGQPSMRVMVVDDSADSRKLLCDLLVRIGFEVFECANGAEAVQAYPRYRPHGILMDLRMPVMDGKEAARRIREMEGERRAKIVGVTADVFADGAEPDFAAGLDDLVHKPFRESELLEKLRRQLGLEYSYIAVETTPEPKCPVAPESQGRVLPTDLRSALSTALDEADLDRIVGLTKDVASHDATLASELASAARLFNYDRLRALLTVREA